MGLPENNTSFPPKEHSSRYSRMKVNATWYGGDPTKLSALYGGNATGTGHSRRGISRVFDWFWGKQDLNQPDDKIHVPVAQDIATLSSELLFSESPRFVVKHNQFLADGSPDPAQDNIVAETQKRLNDILNYSNFDSLLLASAETCAVLGAVGFRIAWDATYMKMPVITRVDADAMIPEYKWGQLSAVTFWSKVGESRDETVWYHLERHEAGVIYHGLYQGNHGNLGRRIPLTEHPATAGLASMVNEESAIIVPNSIMTAVSIPNVLPDPLDRTSGVGRSDFTPGVISLFDAIDRTYSSLMRDIEDAKSRLIVADYMLESRGFGKGVEFDQDQHIFTKLKMSPSDNGDAPITQVQFDIRVDQHLKAIEALTARVIKACGYSPDAEIADTGRAITATEYAGKQKRSMATRDKKIRYWYALERLIEALLEIDAEVFQSGITPLPVSMEIPDGVQVDMKALAETANLMKSAASASTRVRVQTLHPDWDDLQVDAEVEEIMKENGVPDPTTFGLPLPLQ